MEMGYTMVTPFKVTMLTLLMLFTFTLKARSIDNYWTVLEGKSLPSEGKVVRNPQLGQPYALDQGRLYAFLSALTDNPEQAAQLVLPGPDHTNRVFKVWQTPIMEEDLQQKFGQIKTFTAFAVDNPAVTAKLDFTVQGFHAMVLDGRNTYFVDPYTNTPDGYYQVYYKRDYFRNVMQRMSCDVGEDFLRDGSGAAPEYLGDLPHLDMKQSGGLRKTYRLALSCTGEYAVTVGGAVPTTASVLSAMVITMNRVNGIYERELSVTFKLIGNNDLLVYLKPKEDPFNANNSGIQLLDENQKNTTDVIGSANYDIGHIFSTGGGGIALLGCVCKSEKAKGVTGSLNPVGDPYDVDYVCHEIGHQFGATHTFNRCIQEEEITAYEPGGGTTIMSYSGICGGNNIQLHSDAYFHTVSLNAISDYISNEGTCAVSTSGSQPPTLPSINATYYIPYLTSFELESPQATNPMGAPLQYCWEQWNLGDFRGGEARADTFTTGPTFRSFFYDTSRVRVFPKLDSLLKNAGQIKGERLSSVARQLFFKVNVRSVVNGYGAFSLSDDQVTLQVVATGKPFRVIAPNSVYDTLIGGRENNISWEVASTDLAPINTPNVDIYLSVDGGFSYPFLLAAQVPNSGFASVSIPDTVVTSARIKVKGSGNVFFDLSDADLVIKDSVNGLSTADVTLENHTHVYPNPASAELHIVSGLKQQLQLVLYNTLGQAIWQGTMNQELHLPVLHYARGIYFLQMADAVHGGKTMKRISLR